jgi:monofunctional biosynthetic peptidoglycan transglycosylase
LAKSNTISSNKTVEAYKKAAGVSGKSTSSRKSSPKSSGNGVWGMVKNAWSKVRRYVIIFAYVFFGSSIAFTVLYKYVPPIFTPLMIIRVGEQIWNGDEIKLKYKWVDFDKISSKMPLAVIASEDSKFMEHSGFDIDAIYTAYKNNQKKKKKTIKGGSTISQQTAKNVFLWQGRSYLRKGLEVYFTTLIELIWGKKRIMEVYLNVIEMGNGVYGIEAAAQKYYKKPAKQLSKYQCAAITSILPNPRKWSPTKPTNYISQKQQRIVQGMNYLRKVKFDK